MEKELIIENLNIELNNQPILQNLLNEGWQLFNIVPIDKGVFTFYFKRKFEIKGTYIIK